MSTVVATEFVLQDAAGKVRARASLDSSGRMTMSFLNKSFQEFANLHESFDGDGVLYLNGPETNSFMALYAESGNPAIFIYDKNKKILVLDSAGIHQNITKSQIQKLTHPYLK